MKPWAETRRRRVAVLIAVLAAAVVVFWWRWPRGSHERAVPSAGSARTATVPAAASPPAGDKQREAPRGPAPRWSLDVDPDGPLRLEGQVLGPDGKGVGGATVALGSVPPRKTTTDDDGSFAFDKLVSRTYAVVAEHGEMIGGPVTAKVTDRSDPIVIRLGEGAGVEVAVTDEAQQPVAGAHVKVLDLGEHTVDADAKGHALVAPVRPGWVTVEVTADGYAPGGGFTTVGSAGARGTIAVTLKKGVAVSGRVVDERGAAIAKVRVIPRGDDSWGGWGARGADGVSTDDKGQFTLPALAAGKYKLAAVDGEHAPAHSAVIEVGAAPVSGVVITMAAGGVASGRVLDAAGMPVPHATVRIGGAGRAFGVVTARQTTSDAKGAFEVRGLERAKYQARAESEVAASKLVEMDLVAKAAAQADLVLDITGTIAGVVVDETGQPVPEVTVNAWPDVLAGASPESAALAGFSSATTDGAGAFAIRGLPDGAYRLWAARSAGQANWSQSTAAKVGDQNVKVTLPSPGSLRGKIAIQGAGPPTLATVQVGFQPPVPAAAGEFRVEDLAPGKYDITFHSLEFAELIRRNVEIKPGAVTDLGTVTVMRGRQLSGRVLDPRGNPVAGAKVKVGEQIFHSEDDGGQLDQYDALSNVRAAVTDGSGDFTIVGIPEKAGYVAADHPDRGQSLPVPVPAGAGDVTGVSLALKPTGAIAGRVTKRGQPVAGAQVTETTKGAIGAVTYVTSREDGTFTMSHVIEGVHGLSATERRSMQSKTGAATVTVTAGGVAQATIDIPAGDLSLEVTIRPLAGAKLDAAQLFLFPGTFTATNGQELVDGSLQGVGASMKFWFGADKPQPLFGELVAGPYSLCSIPITGDMNDQTFMQRIQENIPALKVYCKPVVIQPQPAKQTFVQELPAMTPLPPPT